MPYVMRDPSTFTIVPAFGSINIDEPDERRKSFLVQNFGPGNIWLTTQQQQPTTATVGAANGPRGIRIPSGATYSDHPIFPHCGVIWLMADAANTVGTFAKWT